MVIIHLINPDEQSQKTAILFREGTMRAKLRKHEKEKLNAKK